MKVCCWTLIGEQQVRTETWFLCETFPAHLHRRPSVLLLDTPFLLRPGGSNRKESNALLNAIVKENPAYHHRRSQWVPVTTSCELKQQWGVQVPIAVTLMCSKHCMSDCCHGSCRVGMKAWYLSLREMDEELVGKDHKQWPDWAVDKTAVVTGRLSPKHSHVINAC